jgi:hypothetical protein
MRDINHVTMATSRIHLKPAAAPESLILGNFRIFYASAGVVWAVRNMEAPSGTSGD